jgi:hypothetical protein
VRRRSAPAAPARTISIGTLELVGFSPGIQHRVAASLVRELERMLADEAGAPAAGGGAPGGATGAREIDASDVRATEVPEQLGARIAASIFGSLK